MAYVYQIRFDIDRERQGSLEIGAPLQQVLGYLRVRLPELPGFISSHVLYSLDGADKVSVLIQSFWDRYEDLSAMRKYDLILEKVLAEFGEDRREDLVVEEFAEVG